MFGGCASDDGGGGDDQGSGATIMNGPIMQQPTMTNTMTGTGGSSAGQLPIQNGQQGQGTTAGTSMPCAVETVVKSGCQSCHGATPIGGAPMSLLTLADFQRDYAVKTTTQLAGQTMKMYELARIRINREMGTTPMPQGNPLAADAFTTLDGWLRSGAKGGDACSAGAAGMGGIMTGSGGSGATTMSSPSDVRTDCDDPKSFEPLVALEGETCYEFKTHGRSGADDTSKFNIDVGESYSQFYFDVPWTADAVETRFGTRFDNQQVLHHWLAFSQLAGTPNGTVSPNVTGTTLFEGAELVAGWAIGGCTTTYPADVGVELPDSGTLMVQWHHYNSTNTPQQDGSAVQICTVPGAMRKNHAGLTFLGTEGIAIPPGGPADATTSCTNNSGAPITIVGFTPHMHTIGSNMRTVVEKKGGESFDLFNKPFIFDQQINYMLKTPYELAPGDTLTTTCSWMNNKDVPVSFGQSTDQEMCYQFTLAYPYGALNNGVFSLIGATNTCW
jgi:hypothetical protein